jgi:mono/diheme cytochrome c family protein
VSRGVLVVGAVMVLGAGLSVFALPKVWAGAPAAAPAAAAPAGAAPGAKVDYTKISPVDLVAKSPKGSLHNPYKDSQTDIAAEGGKFLLQYSCSGCHGGNGGGGMCPALTNDTWVYGGDDDTLFRLVTLGSDELQKAGYMRKGHENVVGPMPPFGAILKSSDDLWKILTFVRSKYSGDPAYKFGDPVAPPEPANP